MLLPKPGFSNFWKRRSVNIQLRDSQNITRGEIYLSEWSSLVLLRAEAPLVAPSSNILLPKIETNGKNTYERPLIQLQVGHGPWLVCLPSAKICCDYEYAVATPLSSIHLELIFMSGPQSGNRYIGFKFSYLHSAEHEFIFWIITTDVLCPIQIPRIAFCFPYQLSTYA